MKRTLIAATAMLALCGTSAALAADKAQDQRDKRNPYESAPSTMDDSAKPDVQRPQTGSTGGGTSTEGRSGNTGVNTTNSVKGGSISGSPGGMPSGGSSARPGGGDTQDKNTTKR